MSELGDHLFDTLKLANACSLNGLKGGQKIGWREGMIHAAEMCEAKAKLHAEYLPRPGWQHNQPHPETGKVDPDLAATCGRRDECTNLAYEIRSAIKAHDAEQLKPEEPA